MTQTRLVVQGTDAHLEFPRGGCSSTFRNASDGITVLDARLAAGDVPLSDNSDLRREIIETFEPRWRTTKN